MNSCQNNGVCINNNGVGICQCAIGYGGSYCTNILSTVTTKSTTTKATTKMTTTTKKVTTATTKTTQKSTLKPVG